MKKSYENLREQLLKKYHEGNIVSIVDDNPEGYTERTYDNLKRVKVPLLLDLIGRTPWTIQEVLEAMKPSIMEVTFKWVYSRPSFHPDEGKSLGDTAVLDSLLRDKGIAWFAGYCYQAIDSSISRGYQKGTRLMRGSHRWVNYSVVSTDAPVGFDEGATIGDFISSQIGKAERERCPICNGAGKVGNLICDRCEGTGMATIFSQPTEPVDPVELALRHENDRDLKEIIGKALEIAKNRGLITDRHAEVISLLYGLDGYGDVRSPLEVSRLLSQKGATTTASRSISKQRVVIIQAAVLPRLRKLIMTEPSLKQLVYHIWDD
jgi:hypothetical protein